MPPCAGDLASELRINLEALKWCLDMTGHVHRGPSGNDYDECSQTADPEANRDEMNRQVVGHQTEPELQAQVGLESKRCHRHGEVPPPRNPDTSEAVKIKPQQWRIPRPPLRRSQRVRAAAAYPSGPSMNLPAPAPPATPPPPTLRWSRLRPNRALRGGRAVRTHKQSHIHQAETHWREGSRGAQNRPHDDDSGSEHGGPDQQPATAGWTLVSAGVLINLR
jgi:hypothetical protein